MSTNDIEEKVLVIGGNRRGGTNPRPEHLEIWISDDLKEVLFQAAKEVAENEPEKRNVMTIESRINNGKIEFGIKGTEKIFPQICEMIHKKDYK